MALRSRYVLFQERRNWKFHRQTSHTWAGWVIDLSSAHELAAFVNISRLLPVCAFTEHLTLRQVEHLLTTKKKGDAAPGDVTLFNRIQ